MIMLLDEHNIRGGGSRKRTVCYVVGRVCGRSGGQRRRGVNLISVYGLC